MTSGKVKVTGNGEGSIVAWYLSKNVVASVTAPYENRLASDTFAKADRRNFIDDDILEKLRNLNVPPSPVCADGEFLRRASLDTIGVLPTADEARAFLADRCADKREKLDRAAAQPAGVRRLLVVRSGPTCFWSLEQGCARKRSNRSRNGFANAWRTMSPGTASCGSSSPRAEARSRTGRPIFTRFMKIRRTWPRRCRWPFCGMSINCARCHDHPLEKWTNDDYYGMASLFARVRGKGWGGDINSGDGDRIIFVADSGELIQPRHGPAASAATARRKTCRVRFGRRPPPGTRRLADRSEKPVFQPRDRQPRVGQLHGPGTGRGRRRHAAHESRRAIRRF